MSFLGNSSGWPEKPLIEVSPLKRGYDLPVSKRTPGSVPIYAANGINGSHNEIKIRGPGVVTGRSGTIGKVHFVEDAYWPLNTALYVTDFKGNDPKWVYYMLQAFHLERFVEGAGVPTLNRNLVHGEIIPVPPLPEQKRIATILDKADTIYRKRQQAIQLADEFLCSVFLDMFGDPLRNENNWPLTSIGNITYNWRGGASFKPDDFTDHGFPVLHKGAVQRNGKISIDTGKKTHTSIEYAEAHDNSVIERDFMAVTLRDLVPTGPSIGLIANLSYSTEPKYILAQGAYGFQIDKSKVSGAYLVALSNNAAFRSMLKRYWVGSTQIHIRNPIFKEIPIPLPPIKLQGRYENIVRRTSLNKTNQSSFSLIADNSFHALSQAAFSGKLSEK